METAYREGYKAALDGVSKAFNPYREGSAYAASWDNGYESALYGAGDGAAS